VRPGTVKLDTNSEKIDENLLSAVLTPRPELGRACRL
jgi:hypothetical protein